MASNSETPLLPSSPLTPEEIPKDELLRKLLIDAQYVYGDSGIFNDRKAILWLDLSLAQSGQAFFQKHYVSLMFAHALYLGLGFGFKPVTALIIKTQSFHGKFQATKRILSTIWHLLRWYEHDLIGVYSEGYKAVARIRKTHESMRRKSRPGKPLDVEIEEDPEGLPDEFGDALEKDLGFLDKSTFEGMALTYDPPEPISQFSLAITQISFLLPVLAHPRAFGIEDMEGFEGFEHLWALIGRLLGIEDEFNIPLQRPGKEFYVRFWKQVWLPSFLVRDSKIKAIQESYYKSTGQFSPQMSVPGNLYFYLSQSEIEGFTGTETYKLLALWEKLYLGILWLIFKLLGASTTFRSLSNWIVRHVVRRVLQNFNPEDGYGNKL